MSRKKLSVLLILILVGIVVVVVLISKKSSFVPLKDERQIQEIVQSRLPWILEVSINDLQKQRLTGTITEILMIYRDGDFEKFLNYLRQRQGRFNPSRIVMLRNLPIFRLSEISPEKLPPEQREEYKWAQRRVEEVASQFTHWPPKDDLNLFKAYWLLHYHKAGPWNAVEIKTAYIRVFQTNQPINPNIALSAIQSPSRLVLFRDTLFPGEEEHPCLYAEVYFVAKHPTPDPHWGYYLWFRWSSEIQNWFLDLVGMTFSGERGENTNLLF